MYGRLHYGRLCQGKPVGTPDASSYYRILQQHDVCAMFTAPTAMRALRREVREFTTGRPFTIYSACVRAKCQPAQ